VRGTNHLARLVQAREVGRATRGSSEGTTTGVGVICSSCVHRHCTTPQHLRPATKLGVLCPLFWPAGLTDVYGPSSEGAGGYVHFGALCAL